MANSIKSAQEVKQSSLAFGAETFMFGDHAIRIVSRDGEPWFVAADVCEALGLTNSRVSLKALDEDEKGVSSTYTRGGDQSVAVVSESGMYTLVLRCRDAVKAGSVPHQFRRWVTSEVLPAIRKVGFYERQAFSVSPTDTLIGEEQETLRLMVKTFVERQPKHKQGGAAQKMWSKLHAHFKVSYRQIPRCEFTEAVSIVTRTAAEWEVVEPDPEPGIRFAVPGHGRYLVVSSHLGSYVYNLGSFSIVASDEARRLQLEMLALSEDLARAKGRLNTMLADGNNTVFRPVAHAMNLL